MKKQDLLSILITFSVGAIAGGYLYLTQAAGLVDKVTIPDQVAETEFTIVSEVYGGCRNTCPSFKIESDGTYRYLYTPGFDAEQIIREGNLPLQLKNKLRKALTTEQLERQALLIEPVLCNSYTDGIDARYFVTLDDVQYTLDSCGTAVDAQTALWSTLGEVWTHFETVGNN